MFRHGLVCARPLLVQLVSYGAVSLQGLAYPGERDGRECQHLRPVEGEGVHAEDDSGLEQVA